MKIEDLYKIAVETRNLEISLFWQRSNYFLVLNTAVAVGYFSLKSISQSLTAALVGAVVSYIWVRVNLGSKYWQSRWEQRASVLEDELAAEMDREIDLFSASMDTNNADVRASLGRNDHGWFRSLVDDRIMSKPSVSFNMTLLSMFFVVFWLSATLAAGLCYK